MGCKIPTVEKCCCCKLTTGGMVLGVYGTIGCVINALFTSCFIIFYDDFIQNVKEQNPDIYKLLTEHKSSKSIFAADTGNDNSCDFL